MPDTYEIVLGHYCLRLRAQFRAQGALAEDLHERLEALLQRARQEQQNRSTTLQRISWCCYTAADVMLTRLGHAVPKTPSGGWLLITVRQLHDMDAAMKEAETTVLCERVEYKMVGNTRGHEQIWNGDLLKSARMVTLLRALLSNAREYLQGQDRAGNVGQDFYDFLLEFGRSSEEMLDTAERMLEVHAP